jgi:mannose/fructose/N-acetylgalactosamine-specific phosphotransferase system component IID
MYLVIIAWLYVVVMMAVAEALSSQGTVLGAVFTLVLYGLLPLSIVVYILGTPGRKRARTAREAAASEGVNVINTSRDTL